MDHTAQSRKRFPHFFSQCWRAGDFPGGQVIFHNHLPSWRVMEKVKFEDCPLVPGKIYTPVLRPYSEHMLTMTCLDTVNNNYCNRCQLSQMILQFTAQRDQEYGPDGNERNDLSV